MASLAEQAEKVISIDGEEVPLVEKVASPEKRKSDEEDQSLSSPAKKQAKTDVAAEANEGEDGGEEKKTGPVEETTTSPPSEPVERSDDADINVDESPTESEGDNEKCAPAAETGEETEEEVTEGQTPGAGESDEAEAEA